MIGHTHAPFLVSDSSHTGNLRRAVKELSLANGLTAEAIGRAEIVATELATNLIKHPENGGEVLLGSLAVDDIRGLEMLALDKGPGMADPERMLEDGVSTVGTLGGGLGAIKRLSDEFDIHSQVGRGTAIFARIWATAGSQKWQGNGVQIGGVTVAMPGEQVSGDRWAAHSYAGTTKILLTDGLGHGHKAALAAEESIRVLLDATSARPADLLRRMHEALQHTQGAVMAIAEIDLVRGTITYSGVGNISARIGVADELKGCVSMPGCVGFQLHQVQEFTYPWAEQAALLMSTDGLTSSLNIAGLTEHHASLIAGVLYRDFRRGTDDATVVVAKRRRNNNR